MLCVDIIDFLVKKGLRIGNGYGKEKVEWWMDYMNKENKEVWGFGIGDWIMKGQNFECHKWS